MSDQNIKIITIDGPSGVGKGTLSARLCAHTGFHFLDSGAIYRVLAWGVVAKKIALDNSQDIIALAKSLPVRFEQGAIYFETTDVTQLIRTEEVAAVASQVAAIEAVRAALLQRQRDFALTPGLVADGRDMGTVVFPEAQLKLFLTASAEIRAERRVNQLKNQGVTANIQQIIADIKARDERDQNRTTAPLVAAKDAIVIDTSDLNIDQVVDNAIQILHQRGI